MPVTAYLYPKALQQAFNKEHDFDTDDYRLMLLTSAYTPSDLHDYVDDVRANEVSGTGYTAGGQSLATKTVNFVDDGSATAWAASTSYSLGAVVRPTTANGHVYVCVQAGTSAATEPTWPTASRRTVTDNTVIWAEAGRAYLWFDAADVTWANSTITARYGVIANFTPGTDATRPLLALIDFGADQSSSNGNFTVQFSALGIFRLFPSWTF